MYGPFVAFLFGLAVFAAIAVFGLYVGQIFDAAHAPAAQDEREESARD